MIFTKNVRKISVLPPNPCGGRGPPSPTPSNVPVHVVWPQYFRRSAANEAMTTGRIVQLRRSQFLIKWTPFLEHCARLELAIVPWHRCPSPSTNKVAPFEK